MTDSYEWHASFLRMTRVAVCCSVLQCVAVCCSMLPDSYVCVTCLISAYAFMYAWYDRHFNLHTATHCNTLQHTETHMPHWYMCDMIDTLNCSTLQYTATHCNTLQHIATLIYMWYDRHSNLQHTATHCNTLQHIATHVPHSFICDTIDTSNCSTPQHTATHVPDSYMH